MRFEHLTNQQKELERRNAKIRGSQKYSRQVWPSMGWLAFWLIHIHSLSGYTRCVGGDGMMDSWIHGFMDLGHFLSGLDLESPLLSTSI